MQLIKQTISIALMGALTGCGAITYYKAENQDPKGLTKFELQSSALRLDNPEPDKPGAGNGQQQLAAALTSGDVVLTSVPTASSTHRYAIEATDQWWWTTTNLGVKKRPDTDVLQELTVNTDDNRKALIENVGAIGVAVIGMLFTEGAAKNSLPDAVDLEPLLAANGGEKGTLPLDFAVDPKGTLELEEVPKDAIKTSVYEDSYFGRKRDVVIYSACRKGVVKLKVAGVDKSWSVVVADPNFVQTIKLPEKGKLTAHAGCGMDSSSDSSPVASGAELVNKLVAQTKAIIEAKKAK